MVDTLEKLCEGIQFGVYLEGSMGGAVSKEGMSTTIQTGRVIRNGQLTDELLLPANLTVRTLGLPRGRRGVRRSAPLRQSRLLRQGSDQDRHRRRSDDPLSQDRRTSPLASERHEELVEAGRSVVQAPGEADDVEVILWEEDERSWAVKNRDLEPEIAFGQLSVGLRALKGGKVAAATTSSLNPEENAAALRVALTCARPSGLGYLATGKVAPVKHAHHSLEQLERDPRALFGLAEGMRDTLWQAPGAGGRLESFEGGVSLSRVARAVVSTAGETGVLQSGLSAWAEVNSAHSEVEFLSEVPADHRTIEGLGLRTFEALPERELAPADLGGPGPIQALLHPRLVDSLVRIVLQEKLMAESAAEGLTNLVPNQVIAAPELTLWDTSSEAGLWSPAPHRRRRYGGHPSSGRRAWPFHRISRGPGELCPTRDHADGQWVSFRR